MWSLPGILTSPPLQTHFPPFLRHHHSYSSASLFLPLNHLLRKFILGGGGSDWRVLQASSAGSMALGGASEHVVHGAAQLDIIVSELAKLGIVEPNFLLLGRGAQAQARDQVHHEQNDAGDTERPGEPSDAVGELVGQLDVVVVEPAAIDLGESVEVSDVVAVVKG